jgi:hypothetical protein
MERLVRANNVSSVVQETSSKSIANTQSTDSFASQFNSSYFWVAEWGNDIRAAMSKKECFDKDLITEGYRYLGYSTIPMVRVKTIDQVWFSFDDRAVTVKGCWKYSGNGIGHYKMIRKKDGKIFEDDIDLA